MAARRRLRRVQDEFDVRFYRWAMAEARGELTAGFPRVRAVQGSVARSFLAHVESLSAANGRRLLLGLTKGQHENALRLTGDTMGADEAELIQAWLDRLLDFDVERPEERRYRELQLTDPSRVRVDRARLLQRVRSALRPVLGGEDQWAPPHACLWQTPVGPWRLRTSVHTGGRTSQLRYHHSLGAPGRQGPYLTEFASLLSWLGIEGNLTTWDRLMEADTGKAVELLTQACAHFLAAAHTLVAGLSPEGLDPRAS